ncbi:MAG: hypothetical protein A3F11_11775 [Gammaproteobacteria bacterium RIFCSPHIGHO2_12_FULL_37_14]|nr:MAG: hypothetical protein A3F11_11775 [Gammaproteobacteria bacterium RIFCSPHIGHO2_12_FULL_37_14]
MSFIRLGLSALLGLLVMNVSMNIQAQEVVVPVVEKNIIISPAPKSVSCTTVNAHWEDNVWVDTQTVCRYESRVEGVAWVNDYWACTTATADGKCTVWELKSGHWVKTLP